MSERKIKSLDTSFDIIEYLHDSEGARVSDIAQNLEYSIGTVHHHLATLADRGYVAEQNGQYQLGLEFFHIGWGLFKQNKTYLTTQEYIDSIAENTGEHTNFIVEENGRAFHIQTARGDHGISIDSHPGKRTYLHTIAAGKAILAHYPQSRVVEILDQWGLPKVTDSTITDREELFKELEEIRNKGYALNRGERVEGYVGVAIAVSPNSSEPVGAIAVGGPAHRLENRSELERVLPELREAVNELELELEFSQEMS